MSLDFSADGKRLRTLATIALPTLGLIWGSNFLFMKWGSETISPAQVTFLRVAFGFLPVFIYGLATRAFKVWHFKLLHHFFVMSLLATSLYFFAFAAGTAILPSGISGALSGSIPLFSFIAAAIFLRGERPNLLQVIGLLIGFAGVLFIARPWSASAAADPLGVLYMILGSASVGVSFVYARKFLTGRGISAQALTTYQMGLSLITLSLVVDFTGITNIATDTRGLIGMVVGLGLLGTGVTFILYYFIVENLGAMAASSATYIPPVIALILGWALANEIIDFGHVGAIVCILAGLTLIQFAGRRN